jgi:putative heme degradation protein
MPRVEKPTKTKKWCKADDDKLTALINDPRNNINLLSSKSNVDAIREYWPHRTDVKQFNALIRKKLQQLELEGHLAGYRRYAAGE